MAKGTWSLVESLTVATLLLVILSDIDVGNVIPRLHMSQLDELTFATDYVARNKPCIILGTLLSSYMPCYFLACRAG
jgi:hypothetical protein